MFDDSGGTKSFVTQKLGPLPVWVYGLTGLAAAVLYSQWKKNKAAATPTDDPGLVNGVRLVGGDQTPPLVFQNYSTDVNTFNWAPPGGGRPHPPSPAPVPAPLPIGIPEATPPPATPAPRPAPTPAPSPAPAPSGQWVTVAKWGNPAPWNSTLWGIAQHFGRGGSSTNWLYIWNAPQNAAEKARRKDPKLIQPGDRLWVPA